jgi:Spherulation-specific family 4
MIWARRFLRGHSLRRTVLPTLLFLSAAPAGAIAQTQNMAVPAYFYPGPYWSQMDGAGPTLRLAVMNPASGPGTVPDPQYVSAVGAARAAGITVVGYVYTSYATRSAVAVEADIDAYYRWYHVDGIFFDEASTNCVNERYYATLNAYVKAKGGIARTILNPGTQTNQCYVSAADILLTFEGPYWQYVNSYSAPAWLARYPASHFWHVVYATPTASAMTQAVRLSKARRAGYVYVTPETLPNPYDVLPTGSYWSDELSVIGPP